MSHPTTTWLLRVTAVLWVIWGLVHVLAGVMTISQDASAAMAGIADAVDPSVLSASYHPVVGALINQHGFNLAWIGVFTVIGAVFIWRESIIAIFLTAAVGGLTDVGYFLFLDLGGFVNFVPGTVMTLICLAAVILSLVAYFGGIRVASQSPDRW